MSAPALLIRPYTEHDEPRVLDLLRRSLGGGPGGERTAAFFRWKHLENPFGRSLLLVAESDGKILGLRAFMRWRLRSGGRTFTAARAVDTATDPEARGRGVFTRLTSEALSLLAADTDLIFNTPNDQSLPGYLKLQWTIVGAVPVRIAVRRPVAFLRGARSAGDLAARPRRAQPDVAARSAAAVMADGDVDGWARLVEDDGAGLHTPRDGGYLPWRYGAASGLDYRAVTVDGVPGAAVFRVRPRGRLWEATVAEVLVGPGDVAGARRLLRAVGSGSGADHVATSFPPAGAPAEAARRRSVSAPKRMTLVVRPLHDDIGFDPTRLDAWRMSLGDLEVF